MSDAVDAELVGVAIRSLRGIGNNVLAEAIERLAAIAVADRRVLERICGEADHTLHSITWAKSLDNVSWGGLAAAVLMARHTMAKMAAIGPYGRSEK